MAYSELPQNNFYKKFVPKSENCLLWGYGNFSNCTEGKFAFLTT